MLVLYILRDDWPTFMISGSNEQLQQELEYTKYRENIIVYTKYRENIMILMAPE